MLTVVWCVALGLAAAPETDQRILELARAAAAAQDRDQVAQLLLGWASLKPRRQAPQGFAEAGRQAIEQASRRGAYALFASRVQTRLRVGVNDPGGLTDRIEAQWLPPDGGEPIALRQSPTSMKGRVEFMAPALDRGGAIVVRAYLVRGGPPTLLRTARIEATPSIPTPPPAPVPVQTSTLTAAPAAEPEEKTFPWWWVAASVAAAALVGAAVWEETR